MNVESKPILGFRLHCLAIAVLITAFPAIANAQGNLIQNGAFQTGDLSNWAVFTTPNGSLGSGVGLPNVVSFDVAGTGTPSNAAQFQAGEAIYNSATGHTSQGGGISQTFTSPAGNFIFSADVAALDINSTLNINAGLFTLLLNGTAIASIQFGEINPGQILRGSLVATVPLTQPQNQIVIEITRPWTSGGSYGLTPEEYLSNIQIVPVPEPGALSLFGFGTLLVLRHLNRRRPAPLALGARGKRVNS
jgi:hypothetical protein